MKTIFLTIMGCVLVLVLASNCIAQKVNTDYDKKVDFSTYSSVSFLGWQDDAGINDFDKKRFMDAFAEEMAKRNISLVESGGDMAIALFIVAMV